MKVSYQWLKELTNINEDPLKVADMLTMAGLSVEKISKTGIGNTNVVVVEILEVIKHQNADKLSVTKVDAGKFGKKQIITNIIGLQKGQKVLAALEGVNLATGLSIKKTKIKDVDSEGMFVGWEELGIPYKSQDLFYLDKEVINGTNYDEIIPFNDSIIEIELTANRGDCLGMIGVTREINTLFNLKENTLDINYKTISKKADEIFKVNIETENCLRYCGGVILDVNIKPSPYWMQLKLIKYGIRPINNVVDITNYILLECNQPLHAFDMDKIKDKKIIIRNAKQNEKLITLDDIERNLEKSDIVIADTQKGHCLGGIMGGQISEVNDNTKNIFLEAAFFKPEIIRATSKRTGFRSESSYRFERAIDKENVNWSLKRALYFFDKLGVGKVCEGIIDVYPSKETNSIIQVTSEWINNKLGSDIKKEKIMDILNGLGFKVNTDKNYLNISIPSWRNDISIKEDIAEEIARIYGYNNIKPSYYPSFQAAVRSSVQIKEKKLRELMLELGCDETLNFSLYGKSLFEKMQLDQNHEFRKIIELDIALSDEWSGFRNFLIPGMIKTASFNVNRQNKSLSLFEIGNTYKEINKDMPVENRKLCILLGGYKSIKDHTTDEIKYDFYDLKGILDSISDYFKTDIKYVKTEEKYFHPYQQASMLINNENIGVIGKLHPMICKAFDIDIDLYIAELSMNKLFKLSNDEKIYKEIPRFPSSTRDIALIVEDNVTSDDILNILKKSNIDILQEAYIFDIYRGENIEKGKYSIAVALIFNKITSTLTDNEVDKAMDNILHNLQLKCNAKIR